MFNFILPKFIFAIERWKYNKEYQIYVSNLGNFKNKEKQNLPIKIHSQKGYCMIKTACGLKSAHRLVMLTWKPIPNAEELTVDHLNHNKRDNKVINLEWVTQEENITRAEQDTVHLSIPKVHKTEIIWANNKQFSSVNAAAEWLITKTKMTSSTKIENIEKKINKAISNHKTYCNRLWRKELIF